ncbi:WD repeat domain phosphoinositide-interacting protein 4-like isoform X1 [Harmonia axyridis]|uniref:WD repeat domain phosphoinositide-interacting protein 4-like isoform X1 n=2 Tax=Harmonia axyridis TaxID=115357 RepID=UPI001E2793A7|nr:WD repeat domain phosphoinositide-interacting protein 4-like isoform X1 [Harmonia axyridis]
MDRDRKISNLRFNQDYGCFTSCMETGGVRVYNVDPLCEQASIDVRTIGTISICEMVYRTNLIGMVSGGCRPKYPDTTFLVFDHILNKFILRLNFSHSIKAVRMKKDKLAISLVKKIYIYSFPKMQILMCMDLRHNSQGILEMTPMLNSERDIVVFPGCEVGALQMVYIKSTEVTQSSTPISMKCHTNELSCIALNQDGSKVATTSEVGTIIRIWDTATTEQLLELRRGCDSALIYSLAFSSDSEYLCCSSDKGTVHIFAISDTKLNKSMVLGRFLGKMGGPLKSFATFQLPPECACVCAFGTDNSVVAIGMDGSFNKYMFNIDGHCVRDVYDIFIDLVGTHMRS